MDMKYEDIMERSLHERDFVVNSRHSTNEATMLTWIVYIQFIDEIHKVKHVLCA